MAIIAYLSSLPPVENEVSRRTLGTLTRNTTGILDSWKEVRGYVPSLNQRFGVEYGKYLLENVARCQSCHNTPGTLMTEGEYLMGGSTMRHERGEKRVPGISSSPEEGLGAWAEEDIVRYLQTGGTPENNYSDASFCPVGFYRNSDPKDLMAIAKYLKTVR
ncbi:MAG: hypothetical protein DCC75_06870 [Proteobacteria bacterium]|nr:MAG: hypothetical protein DCC75_06870 [Pseudomonadota bacterium]